MRKVRHVVTERQVARVGGRRVGHRPGFSRVKLMQLFQVITIKVESAWNCVNDENLSTANILESAWNDGTSRRVDRHKKSAGEK